MSQLTKGKKIVAPGTANADGSTTKKRKGGFSITAAPPAAAGKPKAAPPPPAFMTGSALAPPKAPAAPPAGTGPVTVNTGNTTGNTGPGLPTAATPKAPSTGAAPPNAGITGVGNIPAAKNNPGAVADLENAINQAYAKAGKGPITNWNTGLPNQTPGATAPVQTANTVKQQVNNPAVASGAQPAAPTPLSTTDVINNQLGTDNPFGMRPGDYQDPNNPMYAAARQNMQRELAQRGSGLTAGGMGNSTYAAQLGANTLADFGAKVGTIGEQAYQNDAARNLQAALGAQNLNLGAQGLQMQGQNQLGNLGQILNAIGAGEQSPQNLQALLGLLGLTMGQTGQGNYGSTDIGGGYGTYSY